ncbi:hypothetical protein [Arhodomonas sp. AD133]|uniref:hypothetical protein n=1 Tax=Arhodomonas sp. AD133 TaxID=3415009 RepID=UPI003EBFF936
MTLPRGKTLAVTLAMLTTLATGCASNGEPTNPARHPSDVQHPAPGEGAQSDEELSIISLFLGDDEEDGDAAGTTADTGEQRALRQEIARLRADLRAREPEPRRSAAAGGDRGPGVALLFPNAGDEAATRAYATMARAAGDYPIAPVSPQTLTNAMRTQQCPQARLAECGQSVSAATRARVVAIITGAAPDGDELPLQVTLVDLDLGIEYPAWRIALPATDDGTAGESLAALADAVYMHALERLRLAPRVFHVASAEDGTRWVMQDADADATVGTRFGVHAGGRVIRNGGDAVAWLPDPAEGVLEVTGRTPNGLLILERVSGRAPKQTDLILPAG